MAGGCRPVYNREQSFPQFNLLQAPIPASVSFSTMVSLYHVVIWMQLLAASGAQPQGSPNWQEFWEWTDPVHACIIGNNDVFRENVATLEICMDLCVNAAYLRCLSIEYTSNRQCRLSRVTEDTVDPSNLFIMPCGNPSVQYAGRRVKGFLEWTVPESTCIRGNNQRQIENVGTVEDCQQLCVTATGFFCLFIGYNTVNGSCILSNVNSNIVLPSIFKVPCYADSDAKQNLFSERLVQDSLEWTDPMSACIEGNNDDFSRHADTISDCQQHCLDATGFLCLSIDYHTGAGRCSLSSVNSVTVDPPRSYREPCDHDGEFMQYTERRLPVPVSSMVPTTTMETVTPSRRFTTVEAADESEHVSVMPSLTSSDESGSLPTSELSDQRVTDQLDDDSPTPVWIYFIAVPVGAGVAIAIVVAVILLRNRRRKSADKTEVNAIGIAAPSDRHPNQSGGHMVYNSAYQSTQGNEGEIYNTAYESTGDPSSRSFNPAPAPGEPKYEYAYPHARNGIAGQGRGQIKRGNTLNLGDPVYPREEVLHAKQVMKTERVSAHEYGYADKESAMNSSEVDENQKGEVYNVAYQSLDSPGMPGAHCEKGSEYCYAAPHKLTAPPAM